MNWMMILDSVAIRAIVVVNTNKTTTRLPTPRGFAPQMALFAVGAAFARHRIWCAVRQKHLVVQPVTRVAPLLALGTVIVARLGLNVVVQAAVRHLSG
jgi:hypothetical protein